MDIDEKLVRRLVHLAYRSKKKRTRKKYKNLMFEMMQRQIEIAYEESIRNSISLFADYSRV